MADRWTKVTIRIPMQTRELYQERIDRVGLPWSVVLSTALVIGLQVVTIQQLTDEELQELAKRIAAR